MALNTKKHESIHNKTGNDLARMKSNFDNGKHLDIIEFGAEAAIIYQMQKMQEELDYLRTEIALNKAKTGITSSQASAITANTAKRSMTLGTTSKTALAGNTKLVGIGANTTLSFGNVFQASKGGPFQITMTATTGLNTKSITFTLT
tara:strand:- start:2142 stop:2582 length:441 start_codon:yes stop_codon:yes gene_type:complete